MEEIILRLALRNAVEHGGRAEPGPVLSRLLGMRPELRPQAGQLREVVERVVEEVNGWSLEEQRRRLEEFSEVPDVKKATVKPSRHGLPPLKGAVEGKVVTRLPPEPSGYMHLGHALSGIINAEYARMYRGRLWLRFEDTNPRKVRPEYYESFRRGYRWLGVEWDFEKNNSDDMELYYSYGRKMIMLGRLYACTCSPEEMHRQRSMKTGCGHRAQTFEENLDAWDRALRGDFGEGEISFRLRGILDSDNTTLRDPVLFRIVTHPHPLKGRDYFLWPTYDMAAALQDAFCGVTHVLRSSEFALRDELQNMIREIFGLPQPIIVEYSRFEFRGSITSKREIRSLIEAGVIEGWDDPRLTTIEGVRRRGILPETIREFTLSQTALTYARKEYDWSLLNSLNRKLLDPRARRLFFVPDPVKLVVDGWEPHPVKLPYHPSKDLGSRTVMPGRIFYISARDMAGRRPGDLIRLKYLMNVRLRQAGDYFVGDFAGSEPLDGVPIIQWVC
ncbi:MAG: glutamate--tRNA ligase, partial [Nitrososphaerota archaeon]